VDDALDIAERIEVYYRCRLSRSARWRLRSKGVKGRRGFEAPSNLLSLRELPKSLHCRSRAPSRSIQRQRRHKVVVDHAKEVILRIDVRWPAKKEFIESFHGPWSQRIDDTTYGDLREVRLCPCNFNELELVGKYPCPIRDEVTPREGDVRI